MAVYLINYDLDAPGRNYAGLIKELRRVGAVNFQKSAWFIENDQTAVQIRDAPMTYTDNNDRILVLEITESTDWAGYNFIGQSGAWLQKRRP